MVTDDDGADSAPDTVDITVQINGQAVYTEAGCPFCHAADGSGGLGPDIRGLTPQEIANAPDTVPAHSAIDDWTEAELQAVADSLALP